MMKTTRSTKMTILQFSIAMLVSVIAFFCVPQITETAIGKSAEAGAAVWMTVALGVAALVAAVLLRKELSGSANWLASLVRVAVIAGVYLVASLLISVCNGLIAVVLYSLLKAVLTLDQIKGIIDFMATALTMLATPLLISIFWTQLAGSRSLTENLKWMLCKGVNSYLNILIVMLVGIGIGWLILTVFHYVPGGLLADIAKTLLFGAVGGTMLVLTRNACMKGVNRR